MDCQEKRKAISSKEEFEKALNDPDWSVRLEAKLSNSHMIIKNLDGLLYWTEYYEN